MHNARRFQYVWFKLVDIVMVLSAVMLSGVLLYLPRSAMMRVDSIFHVRLTLRQVVCALGLLVLWYAVMRGRGAYTALRLDRGAGEGKVLLQATTISAIGLLVEEKAFGTYHIGYAGIGLMAAMAYGFAWGGRIGLRALCCYLARNRRHPKQLLLVGANSRAAALATYLTERPQLGYRIIGYLDHRILAPTSWSGLPSVPYLGDMGELDTVLERDSIDEVVIALPIRSCRGCCHRFGTS